MVHEEREAGAWISRTFFRQLSVALLEHAFFCMIQNTFLPPTVIAVETTFPVPDRVCMWPIETFTLRLVVAALSLGVGIR